MGYSHLQCPLISNIEFHHLLAKMDLGFLPTPESEKGFSALLAPLLKVPFLPLNYKFPGIFLPFFGN